MECKHCEWLSGIEWSYKGKFSWKVSLGRNTAEW